MALQESWSPTLLRSTRDVADDVRLFELVPEDGTLPYQIGSHLEVEVLVDGQPQSRAFSLIGDGGPADAYRIAVKNRSDGHGGSKYLWSLEPGARLRVSAPKNMFALTYDAPEYLLVAGGIGITPLFGMATALARRGAQLHLLYAAQRDDQLAFAEELRSQLGPRLQTFVSERGERIDPAREIDELAADAEIYICGPLSLREDFQRAWAEAGRAPSRLRFETFASSGRHPATAFEVEIANHGLKITVGENQSLLQALLENGIDDVLHDCEHGECGLCSVEVVGCDGEIDHRDIFYSDRQHQELGRRRICACVSRVVNGSLIIDTSRQPVDTGRLIED
jgi:vanillate O-demethylase ferredoxin subunit